MLGCVFVSWGLVISSDDFGEAGVPTGGILQCRQRKNTVLCTLVAMVGHEMR